MSYTLTDIMARWTRTQAGKRDTRDWRRTPLADLSEAIGEGGGAIGPTTFEMSNADIIAIYAGETVVITEAFAGKILSPITLVCKLTQVAPYLDGDEVEIESIEFRISTAPLAADSLDHGSFTVTPTTLGVISSHDFGLDNATNEDKVAGEALVVCFFDGPIAVTGGDPGNKITGSISFIPLALGA